MKQLYVLRNGCIVQIEGKWNIVVIKDVKKVLKEQKRTFTLMITSPKPELFTLEDTDGTKYSLRGGGLGHDFDLISEYKNIYQEEMEI